MALPAAWATGAESAKNAATTHEDTAIVAGPALEPPIASSATTRSAVSPQGLGASRATRPTVHAAHSRTVATRAGPVDHPLSASLSAAPAETGSSAHVRRAHHNDTTARSASIDQEPESYPTSLHARHHLRARSGHRD